MFDHITLRVADIPAATNAFTAVFDELEIEESTTTSTPTLSVWGNFAITQTDDDHPIARRVHAHLGLARPGRAGPVGQGALQRA